MELTPRHFLKRKVKTQGIWPAGVVTLASLQSTGPLLQPGTPRAPPPASPGSPLPSGLRSRVPELPNSPCPFFFFPLTKRKFVGPARKPLGSNLGRPASHPTACLRPGTAGARGTWRQLPARMQPQPMEKGVRLRNISLLSPASTQPVFPIRITFALKYGTRVNV